MSRQAGAALLLVATLVGVVGLGGPTPAAAGDAEDGAVDRVLVFSVPTLSWDEVQDGDLPNLQNLFEQSAVADLSVRGTASTTEAGEAYVAIGAGARAVGPEEGAGEAFDVGPEVAAEFEQITGQTAPPDGVVSLVGPAIVEENEDRPYDAEVGALAATLEDEDVDRAVIANADVVDPDAPVDRTAALGLADGAGAVPSGAVGDDLLVPEPDAAGGVELDRRAVLDAFDLVWEEEREDRGSTIGGGSRAWSPDPTVVLVEASDLVRADAVGSPTQRQRALETTDLLVSRLLERVNPTTDAVVVVGPWHRAPDPHLTVASVWAPAAGYEPGLLDSASTRRAGFVTLVDVAPTVLDLLGLEAPSAMEGTPMVRAAGGGSWEDRLDLLVTEDEASRFRDGLVTPVAAVVVLVQLVLWIAAAVAVRRRWSGALRQITWISLANLVFLASVYWAGLLPFERWGTVPYVASLVLVSLAIGWCLPRVFRRQRVDALIAALAIVYGTLVLDAVLLGARLQLSTVFGYSPTVGGRFAGIGNLAFALLAGATVILAGLVAHRFRLVGAPERRAVGAAALVVAVAVLVDAAPMWGSDVGGTLALGTGGALTVYLLMRRRPRWWVVASLGVGAILLLGLATLVDLSRPEGDRTHLGRLFERTSEEGVGAFVTVAGRKLGANADVLFRSVWTLMLPIAAAFVLYLWWRAPRLLDRMDQALPERNAVLVGFAVTTVLGFALNDSGIAVPGVMLAVLNAALVHELVVAATAPPVAEESPDEVPTP